MICPSCGAEVENGFSFCVICGNKLDAPSSEPDYGQADMGGYHSEEEFTEGQGGFTMSTGTFIISDRPSPSAASDIYTADELNESDEDFDFSLFNSAEEYDDASAAGGSVPAAPEQYSQPVQPAAPPYEQQFPQYGGAPVQQPAYPQGYQYGQQGFSQNQSYQYGQQPYPQSPAGYQGYQQPFQQNQSFPQTPQGFPGAPQPQIIGYDPSGMPIYGQPQVMYGQPQIIGYDPSGTPIYGQPPLMYGQPQIIGYDPSGMPIYGQPPVMYGQPQIIGYDPSGMPVYGQASVQDTAAAAAQGMSSMPGVSAAYTETPEQPEPKAEEPEASDADDFWAFFDGGKKQQHQRPEEVDFFGKSGSSMSDLSTVGLDMGGLKRAEKKNNSYMTDTPLVDAGDLAPNDSNKYNKFYMRRTELVSAEDLQANTHTKQQDIMGVTGDVDTDRLSVNEHYRSRITMHAAGDANADDLEAYVPQHRKAMMKQADHAVEALPKKKAKYVDPTDLIELPEHMKAKKTVREEAAEIPSIPKVGIE